MTYKFIITILFLGLTTIGFSQEDNLQIQTDLVVAAAKTGKVVNLKKDNL